MLDIETVVTKFEGTRQNDRPSLIKETFVRVFSKKSENRLSETVIQIASTETKKTYFCVTNKSHVLIWDS